MSAPTRAEALRDAVRALGAAGIDDPAREARLLMRWASGLDAVSLGAALQSAHAGEEAGRFADGLARRAARAPLSHVTGSRAFWGRRFAVTPDVLDPRPETEALVAWAIEDGPADRVLDLGVGSGCILLTLLAEWEEARGVGVDASTAALDVARGNAVRLGVAGRARLIAGDWLDAPGPLGRFDVIAANPPYLDASAMAALAPETAAEPRLALDGGPDGLDAYRRIAARLGDALAPGGRAFLEIGAGMEEAVIALLSENGLSRVAWREDFDHRVRVLRVVAGSAP